MKKKRDPLMKAPFPYYGGKSRAAGLVWEGLGDVDHYVEPCFGSGANLIARPTPPRVETVNDLDCYLTNFWRCLRDLPGTLAELANYPVCELDLHASHRWLVGVTKPEPAPADWAHGPAAWDDACRAFRGTPNADARTFRERMRNDPDYKDPLYAARWVWGICQWIGGGWCQTRDDAGAVENPHADEDRATCNARPFLGGLEGQTGQGMHGSHTSTFERIPDIGKTGSATGGIHGVGPRVPLAERRPALSTGDGPESLGKGIHALGDAGHEQRPDLGGEPGRGVHQSDGTGLPANWERLPDFQHCETGGRGVHGVGDLTDGLACDSDKRPLLSCNSQGVGIHGGSKDGQAGDDQRALSEGRPQLADAYDVGRGVHSGKDFGTMDARLAFLRRWFHLLADRFRLVRVCCGDWSRVVGSESVTTRLGLCGIFLDPPYGVKAKRDNRLYGTDSLTVADEIRSWCIEHQADPKMRIVLAGYEEEHKELHEKHGWRVVSWESKGYGNRTAAGKENQRKERLWYSPHCLKPRRKPAAQGLFD